MASISMLATQASLPPQLLEQLAPNDPLGAISVWPLAVGYWIVLAFLICIIAGCFFYWLGSKRVRLNLKRLRAIKQSPILLQCNEVHLLLRKILQSHSAALASCNENEFSHYVMNSLNITEPPVWLNAHYRLQETPTMQWADIQKLIKQWTKEAPR